MKQIINKNKKKFIFWLNIFPVMGIMLISLVFILISLFGITNYFSNAQKEYRNNLYKISVSDAKKELNSFYALLKFLYVEKEKYLKKELVEHVNMGYDVINSLYKRHISFNVIIKSLANIRFFDDKSGYFFIYDLKGNVLSLPINKSLEGKNLYNYHDVKGNYIIKDMIRSFKHKNEGFFTWYYIYPKSKQIEKKIGFVKVFKPLNIFIGSAIYFPTLKDEIKDEIKDLFPQITKDLNNEIIIYDNKGNVVFSTNKNLQNKNIYNLKIVKNIIKNVKKDRIYSFEAQNKNNHILRSYFRYYPKLGFYIGVKIDKTEIERKILKNKKQTNKIIKKVIIQFLFTALVFIILALILNLFFVKLLEKLFFSYEKELIAQKEKAKASEKAKAEFLANMSHEIRTPLNAMFGFIKILEEKDLDDESKKYLNIIEKSGQNLLTIINDILDFSKIESGKMSIEKIEFNPKEEIEVIKNLFASSASEKNILLEFNTDLKWCIISDPTRIKQVIANLLSNAIKFTPNNKKIILNIKYDANKEELFVEVIDEGIGIEKEKLNVIFESFSQADTSTTRKYGGTGLGLAISYKLIKFLGGELKVESEVNKGSRFYFTISAKKTKLCPQKDEIKTEKILNEKFDEYILVVEDNEANQMFMRVLLDKMGVKFDMANDGIEAIEKFKKNKYDLILMDENMPNMNGIEATKKIRQLERENSLSHTTIVALTANALEGDKKRFILAGMDYYLKKPVDIEKLKYILQKIADSKNNIKKFN